MLCAIHYLCLITTIATAVLLVIHPEPKAYTLLVATTAATILSWFIALLKRRATMCPLCKGTPLVESGARLHERARRLLPFSHDTSAILSILFLQRFRCMYCSADYDLLKESDRHRLRKDPKRRFFFFKRPD